MSDGRKFLPNGTRLFETNGNSYLIRNVIAAGGSSIVYEVEKYGQFRIFILKECYPLSAKYSFERKNGVVCPADPQDFEALDYLRRVKEKILAENEIGQLIANRTGRTVSSWGKLQVSELLIDGKKYASADSLFIVMERVTDDEKNRGIFLKDLLDECAAAPSENAPLRNNGLPSPHVATEILAQLLMALRDIHDSGYIHGDINDSNFFLMGHDFQRGDIGFGQLLDFGNAKKILEDDKTELITDVFSTPGYWSPEILSHSEEGLRLSAASDIYSVGCLMLYLFYGLKYKESRGRDLAYSKRPPALSVPEIIRHGYRRDAAVLFKKILSKALSFNPQDRYKCGGEMLDDIIRLKRLTAPPKFILAQNLSRSPYFVDGSRDKELEELQLDMNKGKHPLFIFGLGGIGKSELANEFARRQISRGTPAYFVTFKGSIRETILNLNFSGYEPNSPGSETDYQRRLDILREYYQGCLLIVDNFDDENKSIASLQSEPAYKELVNDTGLRLLFTTRLRPDETTKELQALTEEYALKLFNSISPVASEDLPVVLELIREVDCHPMTVELLAKTREDSWQSISYKDLLQRLRYRNIDDKNLPTVSVKKNLDSREAKIYAHLKTLFDLYNIGENCRQVLCHVTLLPTDGFDAVTFISNEDDDKKIQLKNLESHSWIRRRKKDNLLTIHPLIRSVFKNELKPADEDCSDFLKKIWNIADNLYPPDFVWLKQAAELFERAANDLPDKFGDFAFYAGYCFIAIRKISAAIFYEDRAVKIREVMLADNPKELARTYNDAGVAALSSENFGVFSDAGLAADEGTSALGGEDFDKAMDYMNKARKILESLPDIEDKQNLANVCASMAMSLTNREDVENALPLAQKAVDIFEKYPPNNLYEKAHAHQTLAACFLLSKRYADALEQEKMHVAIKEKIIPSEHPEIAVAYRSLAETYCLNGDFKCAEAYSLKSIDILEKFFAEPNSELLTSYKLMNAIYNEAGRVEQGEIYRKKSAELFNRLQNSIWSGKLAYAERMIEAAEVPVDESILLNNPVAAEELSANKLRAFVKYNRDAAEACRQLQNFDSAQRFIVAALEKISEKIEPTEAVAVYFTAAQIFFANEKFSEALSFALEAAKKLSSIVPKKFDKLSEQFIFLGKLYAKLGDDQSALKSFEQAIAYQRENPKPENSVMELAILSAAKTLMRLKKFAEAEEILQDLLNKQRSKFPEKHPRIKAVKDLLEQIRTMNRPNEPNPPC